MGSGGRRSLLQLLIQAFLVLVVLATLGISIAILITTLNIQSNQNKATTSGPITASSTGSPPTTKSPTTVQSINVATPGTINNQSPRYSSFQSAANLLKIGLNPAVDPCNDFYQYTCGRYTPNTPMSFDVSDDGNFALMNAQIQNTTYMNKAPDAVQKLLTWYNLCTSTLVNYNNSVANGAQVTNAINFMKQGEQGFNETVGIPFPMFDQTTVNSLTPVQLGYLIGLSAGQFGADNLVSVYTDTNWKDPHNAQEGYKLFIDQPTTLLPNTYYQGTLWATYGPRLLNSIITTMNTYAMTQGKTLDPAKLQKDAQDIVNLDYLLATNFSTPDAVRRKFDRSFNLLTMTQLKANYSSISWFTLIPEVLVAANGQVIYAAHTRTLVVMEPARLAAFNAYLLAMNSDQTNVVLNYIYYAVVQSQSVYLPSYGDSDSVKIRDAWRKSKTVIGRDKNPWKRPRNLREMTQSDAQMQCTIMTMEYLQYANARVFIDKIYPSAQSRIDIRNNVAKIASSIVIGFRSMIDQLDWMTTSSKKGAYAKMENLVKNIAYPDWITDDGLLNQYHSTLNFTTSDDFFSATSKVVNFNMYQQWQTLLNGAANRIDFNGPPGTTNAWYQPELNSITFPAAILRQPFYDPNWPASINFGAMGVIAGHELTHGFDDEGVQWDSTGVLSGWMDGQSQQAFSNMAGCVVNEYSNFCPLNASVYGTGACLNGAQTQGENIADNGGIHSAFRAYKNYVNLYGPDPQLPDPLLQYFTSDQLFFLAFAQVWCQYPPSDAAMEHQILADVHSPSVYRVLGTIQNFPAFRSAFNCPANGSVYAPQQHCDVWVSDISTSYGLPTPKTDTNIGDNPKITPQNVDKYTAYQSAINYYNYSMDLTADPCNNFWQYACGNYHKLVSFHFANARNLDSMIQQLTSPGYQPTIQKSKALQKEQTFFSECVNMNSDQGKENSTLASKNYLNIKVQKLADFLGGQNFPMLTGATATMPTPTQLANALGYLSYELGIDTYISPFVDTYWVNNTKGYAFFIDQNTCEMSKSYYQPQAWSTVRNGYLSSTVATLQQYCREQGIPCDTAALTTNVGELIDFEQILATTYSTNDTVRRQYQRSWNPNDVTKTQTDLPFIDWNTYLKYIPQVAQGVVTDPNFQIVNMEPIMLDKLSKDITASTNSLNAFNVVNYLFMRLVIDSAGLLPSYNLTNSDAASARIGLKRRTPGRIVFDAPTQVQESCMSITNNLMQYSNGRVFIDYMYPDQASKDNIRSYTKGVITNVVNSFQGMLEQLDWMDPQTKMNALAKTTNLQINIAYPDFLLDDTELDNYYADLTFQENSNYFDMLDTLTIFNIELQYKQLTASATDRSDFLGQPATVNAWYQPELNSITFPAGILVPPYFHPLWPASINYGGLGVVAGHELTHGFDDEGVQWGPSGNLATWMDDNSTTGFKDMAHCVILEYDKFCPLNGTSYQPQCVNGEQTQGENIADNGGIHAAYRAYRVHTNLLGPDPQLNDRVFGQFTHDQLFFINFGQVWCEQQRSQADQYKQLMVDPHSPSQYRVFGTIQNFPAFQTAFNCPSGSNYAPTSHCYVWVPKNEA